MSVFIDALDSALLVNGEDFILRRVIGTGANITNIDVKCIGKIDVVYRRKDIEVVDGIIESAISVIFSPTQINRAQWPGGTVPVPPPFDVDPRVPRIGGADKVIIRGALRQIEFVKPFWQAGDLCRIEMFVAG
jgi:hypothetical protein